MRIGRVFWFLILFGAAAVAGAGQTSDTPLKTPESVSSSPAFAELILRTTEIESELEELLVAYTEEYPKVKHLRHELGLLRADIDRISRLKPAETGRLTLALGKLLVGRARVATDHWVLRERYNEEHPDVKKAKRKLEIYERAVGRILG